MLAFYFSKILKSWVTLIFINGLFLIYCELQKLTKNNYQDATMHIYRLKATGNVMVIGRAKTGINFIYFLKSLVGSVLSTSTGLDYA